MPFKTHRFPTWREALQSINEMYVAREIELGGWSAMYDQLMSPNCVPIPDEARVDAALAIVKAPRDYKVCTECTSILRQRASLCV